MQTLYVTIYCLPLGATAIALLAVTLAWCAVRRWMGRRNRAGQRRVKLVMALALALWLAAILHMTVFSRTPGTPEAELMPLHQLWVYFHGGSRELLRTLWMNVLLFTPGGLLLAALWPEQWRRSRRFWLTVVLLTAVSGGIEWVQFHFGLGLAETDDVLCNALGAILGAIMNRAADLEDT